MFRQDGLAHEVLQWYLCRLEAWFAADADMISLKTWDQVCRAFTPPISPFSLFFRMSVAQTQCNSQGLLIELASLRTAIFGDLVIFGTLHWIVFLICCCTQWPPYWVPSIPKRT